jgi:DNA modification methylase
MTQEKLNIEYLPIKDLKPYKRNARKHTDSDVATIVASIKEFGFADPIGVWGKDNMIVEGHGRLMAAKKLGMDSVPVIRLDHLTDEQRRAYALAHNKTAEMSEWDVDFLGAELDDILNIDMSDFGFNLDNLDEIFPEIVEDEIPEDAPSRTKPGDIWALGDHRLAVGDSTDKEFVAKLMNGQKADLYITDPPYNVDYHGNAGTIKNDNMEDTKFRQFLGDAFKAADSVMRKGAVFYIWHADSEGYNFRGACRDTGWQVRECLIWNKNSLVMGRSDYHYKHEPCAIPGSMVWTPDGEKPIEELKDGDRVISYDPAQGVVKGYKEGYGVKTAHRHYSGKIYGICVGEKETWVTDNHRFTVRFNPECAGRWCTYLMVNEDGWWRVGCTRTYDARQFGLRGRMHTEKAIAAWIIDTHKSRADAQMMEQYLSTKYGIPYTFWTVQEERGIMPTNTSRTRENIEWLYGMLDLDEMRQKAEKCLSDFGRSIEYPLITKETGRFSRRSTTKINACNLIPDMMMVPIPYKAYRGSETCEWAAIDAVPSKEYDGEVYSLAVEKYEHYVQDGIITHNCLYGWKDGASHLWASDRKQCTVLDYDKPKHNDLHPTMKPVELFAYQISNNTHEGDSVLDSFSGSGTTIMACEQLGRKAYGLELDTHYADVILQRWENFTNKEAKLISRDE